MPEIDTSYLNLYHLNLNNLHAKKATQMRGLV